MSDAPLSWSDLTGEAFPNLPNEGALTIGGAAQPLDALFVAEALKTNRITSALWIVSGNARLAALAKTLDILAPNLQKMTIPAWDCLPYDRVSPDPTSAAEIAAALAEIAQDAKTAPLILAAAPMVSRKIPPKNIMAEGSLTIRKGERQDRASIIRFLERWGFRRAASVAQLGDYALRGSIIDVYPPRAAPTRIDFFGDEAETLRHFDVASQRTLAETERITIRAASEVRLDEETAKNFRTAWREIFGVKAARETFPTAIGERIREPGMEHNLPLFYQTMTTIFSYIPQNAAIFLDPDSEEAAERHRDLIRSCHDERARLAKHAEEEEAWRPLPPKKLWLDEKLWRQALQARRGLTFSPFAARDGIADLGGRAVPDFSAHRIKREGLLQALRERAQEIWKTGGMVLLAARDEAALNRLENTLEKEAALPSARTDWTRLASLPPKTVGLIAIPLETGFRVRRLTLLTEGDLFGHKRRRPIAISRADAKDVLRRFQSLMPGDLIVHLEHGVGRFHGLRRLRVSEDEHECFELVYQNDDRLLLPVENAELLSRYGGDGEAPLDKLGAAGWQARHARVKKRVREMAGELIRLAAERSASQAARLTPPQGLYDEFRARFPYDETPDQARAEEEMIADLSAGKPMDRLICGDVGFGKTELALRAAFIVAMAGRQSAIITPTTLLCRQHLETFRLRFEGLPMKIGHVSRLVSRKEIDAARRQCRDGTMDIVIGTHALLSEETAFRDLGLLVVDEEQHFGVAHKERLKALKEKKENVHVLTLTATPIPRTLQLALSGARDMSLIGTPPRDRISVQSFVGPFDAMTLRRAMIREKARGGQSFIVVPRISDLPRMERFLETHLADLKRIALHGRMPPKEMERGIGAFYDGNADILLSTHIVESGLDIPAANTIIIYRSHMFGLAQLHQLRGRVGRSDRQAYAYFTLPAGALTGNAERRLSALQAVDSLGAGFSLAAQDLDLRGAGNLLGAEQSGHIREVGYELYQQMLEDAVRNLRQNGVRQNGVRQNGVRKEGESPKDAEAPFSPTMRIGVTALIPEDYAPDLALRLRLYRRLADMTRDSEIEEFREELRDRFGATPPSLENLLKLASLKNLCRRANIASVEAGAGGGRFTFHRGRFANPEGLARFLMEGAGASLSPDHVLSVRRDWRENRMEALQDFLARLVKIAENTNTANNGATRESDAKTPL